jgi:chemotaxis protein methyltransferase CheR
VNRGAGAAALRLDDTNEVEEIEIRLLLEGIHLRYGYDFREYALNPLRRGIQTAMAREHVHTVSAYQERLLRDADSMQRFLSAVGVNVTSMFRDPDLMRAVRQEVVPTLRTYPSSRVWIAGCATGEEVYGYAVLLEEEGVLDRCTIYATDLNEEMLSIARTGSYGLDKVRRYEDSYRQSGGTASLSDHYSVAGRTARFNRSLQKNVTWSVHNLASDGSFNDFHLVVCANVLIYFRDSLQARAHRLIYDSLVRGGHLAMGKRESLLNCPDREHYEQVRDGVSLFRKLRW